MITINELRVLLVLDRWMLATGGVAPRTRELCAVLKMGNTRLADALKRLGERRYVRKLYYRKQALEVLRRPEMFIFDNQIKQLVPLDATGTAGSHPSRGAEGMPEGVGVSSPKSNRHPSSFTKVLRP